MANPSLSDSASLINQQAEHLCEYLAKAEALVEIALGQDTFCEHAPALIYHYIWALSDFIGRAKGVSDKLATGLLKNPTLVPDIQSKEQKGG